MAAGENRFAPGLNGKEVIELLEDLSNILGVFLIKQLLYGYFHPCKFKTITNFTLLAAKYFIYRCFLNEEPLDFELYKLLVREKILTEQLIASKIIITIIYHPFSYFYYFQF